MAKQSIKQDSPAKPTLLIKRFFDIFLSGLAILFLLPFFIFFTSLIAIKMSGNPFFIQKRIGKSGKIFELLKFRTMTNKKDKNGNLLPDTQRITKFGNLIRDLSIDELPELINIFIGDMSIVGPRPLPVQYVPFYTNEQKKRHKVRPGLTGLAQINGRNLTPWNERFVYDIDYINNLSVINDIKIIIRTVMKVIKKSDIAIVETNNNVKSLFDVFIEENGTNKIEIGSNFIFDNEVKGDGFHINTDKKNQYFCNNGRNAIGKIIEITKVSKAFIPVYTCESVIEPFANRNIDIEYYGVNKDLINFNNLIKKVSNQKEKCIVFLQSYFGKYNLDKIKKKLKKNKNLIIVEDITQCLFNNQKFVNADFYVGSIRKWCGVGEGAIIACNEEILLDSSDNEISNIYTDIATLQHTYFENALYKNIKTEYRKLLIDANEIIENKKLQVISSKAKEILDTLDMNFIAKMRKQNYLDLYLMSDEFGMITPILGQLNKNEVPLYFPIYCKDREKLIEHLCKNNIYPPIIWPECKQVADQKFRDNKQIYNEILCFPIDQRYNRDNMIRIFEVLKEYNY